MQYSKKLLSLIFPAVLAVLMFSSCATRTVYVRTGPPVAKVEVRTAKPYNNAVWISGHYVRKGNTYVWKKGYWTKPKKGFVWVPGHWKKSRAGWTWKAGHWRRA